MQAYFNPSLPEPGRREKINMWCLKILHKTFWGTTRKKREFLFLYNFRKYTG